MMPIEAAGLTRISEEAENLTSGDEYSITITPGADWYAGYAVPTDSGNRFVNGDKGKPLTYTAAIANHDDGNSIELRELIGAAPSLPMTDEDSIAVRLGIYKDITA